MKINSLKKLEHGCLIHTCKSGIAIFARRVTWNYAYSPFNLRDFFQTCLDLVVHPPEPQDPSYPTWISEVQNTLNSFAKRADMVANILNGIEGMRCNVVQGAMYAFPRVSLTCTLYIHSLFICLLPWVSLTSLTYYIACLFVCYQV